MHTGAIHLPHRLQAPRPQAVFFLRCRPLLGDVRFGQCTGLRALRHPHIARHTRVPSVFGPRKRFAARVRALYVRIHTLTLKFLQGHT